MCAYAAYTTLIGCILPIDCLPSLAIQATTLVQVLKLSKEKSQSDIYGRECDEVHVSALPCFRL